MSNRLWARVIRAIIHLRKNSKVRWKAKIILGHNNSQFDLLSSHKLWNRCLTIKSRGTLWGNHSQLRKSRRGHVLAVKLSTIIRGTNRRKSKLTHKSIRKRGSILLKRSSTLCPAIVKHLASSMTPKHSKAKNHTAAYLGSQATREKLSALGENPKAKLERRDRYQNHPFQILLKASPVSQT